MGALKHFVLPIFGLVHAVSIAACSDLKKWAKVIGKDDVTDNDNKSIRQKHMLGCLRGLHAAMLGILGFSVFSKNSSSDLRQGVAASEALFYMIASVDAYNLGELNFYTPAAFSLLGIGGMIVSHLEPGIFTKDRSK